MTSFPYFKNNLILLGVVGALTGCAGPPRAVMLPLQYPDGTYVKTTSGETAMAGYQTDGSSTHARAIALYEQARPPSCATCARVGAVVTEPSVLRQATGVLGTATIGAGAVMTGVGVMDYGIAAKEGKLDTNVSQNSESSQYVSNRDRHHDDNHRYSDRYRTRYSSDYDRY